MYDLFYVIEYCSMYNSADDNTVSHIDEDINQVVSKVEREVIDIMLWFNAKYENYIFRLQTLTNFRESA